MKQFPKLSLVTKDDQQPGSEGGRYSTGFDLVALQELTPIERDRIQNQISEILPKATIIAAARTPRAWDLRPVVTRTGENEPSIIRFAGPDIIRSNHLTARLRETLERLKNFRDLSSGMLAWGTHHGDLWFRRPLVESTLAHVLSGNELLNIHQTLQTARALAEEVSKWHEKGVLHAHITSSNIVLRPNGRVALLDAGIGLATLQSGHATSDYNPESFAPEVLTGEAVVFRSDLYGLGLVYRRLFATLSRSYQLEKRREQVDKFLRPLIDLSNALLDSDPNRRPPLGDVRKTVTDTMTRLAELEERRKSKSRPGTIQGRILRSGKPELAQPDHDIELEAFREPVDKRGTDDERGHRRQRRPKPERPSLDQLQELAHQIEGRERATHVPFQQAQTEHSPVHQQPISQSPGMQPPVMQGHPQQHGMPVQNYAPHSSGNYPVQPPGAFTGGPHVQTTIYQAMAGQPHHAHPHAVQPMPQPMQGYAPHPGQPIYVHGNQYPPQPHYPVPGYGTPMYTTDPSQGQYLPAHVHAPHHGQSGSHPVVKDDSSWTKWLVLFGVVLLAFWYYRTNGMEGLPFISNQATIDQFREDWTSRIPSRMLPVALAAIDKDNPSSAAESVILSSVRTGDIASAGVNAGLLKIAFDDRWEVELTEEDRRVSLALGLSGLLKQHVPKDLAALDNLHPGVVLAIVSSIGRNAGKNFFAAVPANRLSELPPPIGPSFKLLVDAKPDLTCGDEEAQRLARLGTRGVEFDEVSLFLKSDTKLRLRALAVMYSQDNARAQTLLEVLLKDGSTEVNDPWVGWGRAFGLLEWTELESSDRLFVLAGTIPSRPVSASSVKKLLAHPEPVMRSYALRTASTAIRPEHPGAITVLDVLQKDPQLLTAEQTVELMTLLVNPAAQKVENIRVWLESSPPLQVVVPLLLSTAEAKKGTLLDTSLAVYLKGKSWKPGVEVLRKLSLHPDSYTRFFAYDEIYLMQDRETAKEFLTSALKRETDEENRQQLNKMLLDLAN